MAVIRPFRGLRAPKSIVSKLASLPYDVLSSEEAREIAKDNPYSFLHVTKSEIDLPPNIDLYSPQVYEKARENFEKFKKNGWLIYDEAPYLYIYRQVMEGREQTGVMACCSAEEYWKDIIKKHELTRKDKEDDRVRHVDYTNANTGPVFLTYRAVKEIDDVVQSITKLEPEYDFTTDDKIQHVLWVVKDKQIIENLVQLFAKVPVLYVADGHHRSAAAARIALERKEKNPKHTGNEEYNFFLAVLFPHNQLKILDYNRAVKDLNGLTTSQFIEKIKEKFEVFETNQKKPEKPKQFGMYLDKKWYRLIAKPGTYNETDPVKCLDVSILQDNLLQPILGINDPRTDKRIDFIGGIRGVEELERVVDSGKFKVSFSMYPTSIEQLMAIADAGKIMPPKSTWFEPKLRCGVVIHTLEDF